MTTSEDQEDQSMEEILQSIKRIIAEEEPEEGAAAAEAPADAEEEVLDLTDKVNEDGTIAKLDAADTPALEEEIAVDSPPLPAVEPEPVEEPIAASPEPTPIPEEGLVSDEAAGASNAALEELLAQEPPAAPAPKPIAPSPVLRNGTTVEDLVVEALRPMLKEWLDANLPQLVENLVQQEIKRITPR